MSVYYVIFHQEQKHEDRIQHFQQGNQHPQQHQQQ